MVNQKDIITIPELKKIPFLTHGFGNKNWRMQYFKQRKEWQDFQLVWLQQIHSNIVHAVRKAPAHNLRGDALITDQPLLLLIVKSADCLPVLIVEEKKRLIAAIHCGWQGTRKRIIQQVMDILKKDFGGQPSSVKVAMGPHIKGECYEIGQEVHLSFLEAGFPASLFRPVAGLKGKYMFDLAKANFRQLIKSGVKADHIFNIDICSHCHPLFPSYRRDKEKAGRMLSFIGLKF